MSHRLWFTETLPFIITKFGIKWSEIISEYWKWMLTLIDSNILVNIFLFKMYLTTQEVHDSLSPELLLYNDQLLAWTFLKLSNYQGQSVLLSVEKWIK